MSSSNKQYLLPIALLFLVIVVLLATSVFILTPNIQNDLAEQIKQELSKQSIAANITLSGRDVILSGTVSDIETKQKAEAVTEKICGIRFIDNQLLTVKKENLALLTDYTNLASKNYSPTSTPVVNNDNDTKASKVATQTASVQKNNVEVETNKPKNKEVSSLPLPNKENIIEKKADEKEEKNTVEIASIAKSNSPQAEANSKQSHKGKILSYDTMLAAMKAYQSQKGRNPKRSKSTKIRFKKDSSEVLPESNTELNEWATHLKKANNNNKTTIEITVIAENSSLAVSRAKAIRTYFVNSGMKESNIKVVGKKGQEAVHFKETN